MSDIVESIRTVRRVKDSWNYQAWARHGKAHPQLNRKNAQAFRVANLYVLCRLATVILPHAIPYQFSSSSRLATLLISSTLRATLRGILKQLNIRLKSTCDQPQSGEVHPLFGNTSESGLRNQPESAFGVRTLLSLHLNGQPWHPNHQALMFNDQPWRCTDQP